ncbi:hypothetical protein EVAR_82448_1 [Eumeta japonica]|uniref:Uncharacterized protein n=1 Tax=Eumeta variegata TaxID=151549 RepID=A0A4C1X425_EUMVA|nr:hypothetical protein EVAR_82448_1 [Eumeta japonica]
MDYRGIWRVGGAGEGTTVKHGFPAKIRDAQRNFKRTNSVQVLVTSLGYECPLAAVTIYCMMVAPARYPLKLLSHNGPAKPARQVTAGPYRAASGVIPCGVTGGPDCALVAKNALRGVVGRWIKASVSNQKVSGLIVTKYKLTNEFLTTRNCWRPPPGWTAGLVGSSANAGCTWPKIVCCKNLQNKLMPSSACSMAESGTPSGGARGGFVSAPAAAQKEESDGCVRTWCAGRAADGHVAIWGPSVKREPL